jgi:hypothetical protein
LIADVFLPVSSSLLMVARCLVWSDRRISIWSPDIIERRAVASAQHGRWAQRARRPAVLKAIQELAGRTSLTVTLQYMHLAPSALRDAINLLDQRAWQRDFEG